MVLSVGIIWITVFAVWVSCLYDDVVTGGQVHGGQAWWGLHLFFRAAVSVAVEPLWSLLRVGVGLSGSYW